jgi:hypothetical protein
MLTRNRFALKEWLGACERLARGEHAVLLRKGGLRERRDGFELEHREFFLFPTGFHERGQEPPDRVELSVYAEVADDREVDDLALLRRLEGTHALDWSAVEQRFHYRRPGLHALLLRAWRLERPEPVLGARAHDGCVSWVDLGAEREVGPCVPALGDADFGLAKAAFEAALHG